MRLGRESRFKNAYVWWVALFLIVVVLSFKLPVGQQLNLAFAPLLHGVQAPVRWYQDISLWFESSSQLQARLRALETEVKQQQALKQKTATLSAENKQLRQFLNITQIEHYAWRVAGVVSRGPEKKSRRLMVEVPQAHADDVVVSHEGLVGLVDTASKGHAVVRTILDASVTVPVTMQGSRLAGLVRGAGDDLIVDFVPLELAPKIDDILITSGAGGVFPAGLSVAKVTQVKPIEGGVFVQVSASPAAAWQRDAWLAVATKKSTEQAGQ
jgi:rod shape-determining protein MreC